MPGVMISLNFRTASEQVSAASDAVVADRKLAAERRALLADLPRDVRQRPQARLARRR